MDEGLTIRRCIAATCDAHASVAYTWYSAYAGPEGNGFVEGSRVDCAAGHHYTEYGQPVIDPESEA